MVASGGAAWLLTLAFAAAASAQDAKRSVEEILKDVETAKAPAVPANTQDRAAVAAYLKARTEMMAKRAELALELYKAAPDHEALPELMAQRWATLRPDQLDKEVDEVLAHVKNDKLQTEGAFAKARAAMAQVRSADGFGAAVPAIEAFLARAPKDPRAGQLLYILVNQTTDEAKRAEYEEMLLKTEGNPYAEMVKDSRWRREQIGKPFKLEFEDAVKGTTVSIEGLKGKVVVIDFWATWCRPCIAEMPKMKQLYADYKDKGVEFIGVSLDQPKDKGGLDKLKDYVAKNDVQWPQYYQGNYGQSEFSSGWKVKSIPCVFVVDQEGNLYSTEARGKLETMIPELLKKGAATAGDAGGN
jgi:thiol-disulfide isomerase/thioredoxin